MSGVSVRAVGGCWAGNWASGSAGVLVQKAPGQRDAGMAPASRVQTDTPTLPSSRHILFGKREKAHFNEAFERDFGGTSLSHLEATLSGSNAVLS